MHPYYQDDTVTLHHGDALGVARTLTSGSVQTIVTSPPYFGLRDYGEDHQIGSAQTIAEYVASLVDLFHELHRVLADDGTFWLNLGDSYNSTTANANGTGATGISGGRHDRGGARRTYLPVPDLAMKSLIGVPWRVAFALQDDGWILRSDIIWAKPNAMPSSVTDRVTSAHEYLFMLTKNPRYYYDADAIAEPVKVDSVSGAGPRFGGHKYGDDGRPESATKSGNRYTPGATANKRSVWVVPTTPFVGAHFATYPPELIRPCILAGSHPGDIVLDPFSGSGTTGMVATQEGRRYVGIDLNAEYLDLSLKTRFLQPTIALGNGAA